MWRQKKNDPGGKKCFVLFFRSKHQKQKSCQCNILSVQDMWFEYELFSKGEHSTVQKIV